MNSRPDCPPLVDHPLRLSDRLGDVQSGRMAFGLATILTVISYPIGNKPQQAFPAVVQKITRVPQTTGEVVCLSVPFHSCRPLYRNKGTFPVSRTYFAESAQGRQPAFPDVILLLQNLLVDCAACRFSVCGVYLVSNNEAILPPIER